MDKSNGQAGRTAVSAPTREKLLTAAAELIAELGWGRVTTRAVAERAGLPHGAVSYHFRGKQELLIEAAMFTFARAMPEDEFAALAGVEDFIELVPAEVADRDAIDPVLSRLMFEAMREAERDPALRDRMRAMLARYRDLMVQAIRAGQERGVTRIALLCGNCSCGCPEVLVDRAAAPERRIVITDDFGQRVQMSADQFLVLVEEARSGRLDEEG